MPFRRPGLRLPALVLMLVWVAACGSPEEDDNQAETDAWQDEGGVPDIDAEDAEGLPEDDVFEDEAGQDATDDEAATTLATATSEEYGEYLVDGEGVALYVSATDPPAESTCTDACLDDWPILSVDEDPTYTDGVDGDLVGVLERDDLDDTGFDQVTYRDKPLHYHRLDQRPGMVTGHGSEDRWFLIGPDGVELRD